MMELEEHERRKEHIESLNPTERGVFADMIMRSLRGSWRSPRKRAHMLEWIGETDEVEYHPPEALRNEVKAYFEKIGRGSPDGRFWRRIYEREEVDVTTLEESKVRELASHIPDDMTWDDYRINREFGETND